MQDRQLAKAIVIAEKGLSFQIVKDSGLMPPLEIMNSFFRCGIDDAASEMLILLFSSIRGYFLVRAVRLGQARMGMS